MTDLLQQATSRVQDSMDEILRNFKSGAKITVLVRAPDKATADFCMSDDNLWEVAAMLQRRMSEAGYPVISSEPLAFISQKAFGQLIADRSGEYRMTVPRDKPGPMEVALFTWPTPVPEANPPAPVSRGPTLAETDATNAEAGATAISAILDGPPSAHNGCVCSCHRGSGIIHFVACCSPSAAPSVPVSDLERAAQLAETYDHNGMFAEGLPKGWAGCRRSIAEAIRALSPSPTKESV